MAYDQVDWHYGAQGFAEDLPPEAGGVHIGMFLAWAFNKGFEGELHRTEAPDAVAMLRNREITGCQYLFKYCDEKFWKDDLNEEGNAFAQFYYGDGENFGHYMNDYDNVLCRG